MTAIAAIAALTIRDALRQKLAVNLLFFALLLIAVSITVSELTFGEQYRIISDLAVSAAGIFGTLIAVFLGAGLVAGDVQRRTLYPIIAKPVSRTEYLLGRYAGLLATLALNLAVMAVATLGVLAVYRGGLGALPLRTLAAAFLGLGAQLAVVGAIAILFSSFTNTTLAAIFTLALAVSGHFARDVFAFWRERAALRTIGLVLPNLGALDFKVAVVYEDALGWGQLGWPLLYAALYVAVTLAIATAVFERRDFR
jgi:ABC-type transport system involved in multi-copper enzyme maturation permease subunit